LPAAFHGYEFLASPTVERLWFDSADEDAAVALLRKYSEHALSFQDALCAVLMLKRGVLKAFTFDADFWTLGFEVVPGPTR
jgi:predicted nucleic acid-binding protein